MTVSSSRIDRTFSWLASWTSRATAAERGRKRTVVLAASVFHFGEYTVGDVKAYLAERGIPVRPAAE